MARKKVVAEEKPLGPLIAKNLARLGYAETVVKSSEVSRLVKQKTGKTMSRQRVSAIMNAVRVEKETIETLARALGVKASDLLRED